MLPHFFLMPRVKLFNENEVLLKAMNLFWKQGYSATSVQDLVSHLGINRGSLYDTFGDKEQLFKKSFALYRKSNFDDLTLFFQRESNVKKGFSELFRTAIEEALNDKDKKGCFVVNTTTELIPNDESLLKVLDDNKKNFQNLFYEYLRKGHEDGQFKTNQDLKSLSALLFTIYIGIRVVSKVNPNRKELSASIDVALSLLT